MEKSASMTVMLNARRGPINPFPLLWFVMFELDVWFVDYADKKVRKGRVDIIQRSGGQIRLQFGRIEGHSSVYTKWVDAEHVFSCQLEAHNALCEMLQHDAARLDRLAEEVLTAGKK